MSLYRCKFSVGLLAVVISTPVSTGFAQETKFRIPEYEAYAEVDFLHVSQGRVKAKQLGEKGWYVAIDVPATTSRTRVTLTADEWKFMRLLPLRGPGGRLSHAGDSIEVTLPVDGRGWFFLLNPFPDVLAIDYRPKTLFKLPNNTPEKAKFPVVDIHAHLRGVTAEQRLEIMNAVGVAMVIDSPLGMRTDVSYARFEEKYPLRFMTFASLNFASRFQATFPNDVIGKLRADVDQMRVPGIAEVIDKGSGIYSNAMIAAARPPMFIDDERVMPIWRAAAKLKLPVLIHVGEPIWFYQPIDENHEFFQWQANNYRWNLSGTKVVSRDEMLARRARIMTAIPELVVIGLHMGHLEDDLMRLGEELDRFPNLYVEMGVRHVYLGLQPNTARRFHIKYQDRILFGQDGALPIHQYRQYFRFLETDDDQIMIRPNEPKIYGLNLPDEVLRKVYYGNAARLMPRVKAHLIQLYPDLKFPTAASQR